MPMFYGGGIEPFKFNGGDRSWIWGDKDWEKIKRNGEGYGVGFVAMLWVFFGVVPALFVMFLLVWAACGSAIIAGIITAILPCSVVYQIAKK